jgi:hypothetical protein
MKTNYIKRTGQGNRFSKFDHKIFRNNTSILSRLQSRTLTGRGLQIKVHQHMDRDIHFVWRSNTLEMGLESIIWNTWQMARFCKELQIGGLENLCDCVTDEVFQALEGKVESCYRARYGIYPANKKSVKRYYPANKKSIKRYLYLLPNRYGRFYCLCNITSIGDMLDWN